MRSIIAGILSTYDKTEDNLVVLVGDNSKTNVRLAKDTAIPFVGCHAHLLNLAMCRLLDGHKPLIKKIHSLIRSCRYTYGICKAVKLSTGVMPHLANITRWRSMFAMLKSFSVSRDVIPYDAFTSLLPFRPSTSEIDVVHQLLDAWENHLLKVLNLLDRSHVQLSHARQ